MYNKKRNCWQFMNCGREPFGWALQEEGPCPASTESTYDCINSGINAGRFCWAVVGSFSNIGRNSGCFCQNNTSCLFCDFFKIVESEEGKNFALSSFFQCSLKKQRIRQ
ncbi:MAG: hypothetical protein L3V56_08375 [Candidatus Magnetoovum sp. WYHC-5]|nr:hypothetical protein [Candidatus Magnetoovum sp. WYHC-5]